MTSKTKLALSILGAVAAGAIMGLLLAPEKGSDMRNKIKSTANDWASCLSDFFAAGKAEVEQVKSSAAKSATDLQNAAKNTINRATESFS